MDKCLYNLFKLHYDKVYLSTYIATGYAELTKDVLNFPFKMEPFFDSKRLITKLKNASA